MPAKSRRKRGKNLPPSKRKKDRVNAASTPVIPDTNTTQDTEPVSIPEAVVPSEKIPMPSPKTRAVRYPYITRELWTISGLGVLMIIVLIILAASV